jgi:hypothetical protein
MCNLSIWGQVLRVVFGATLVVLAWFGPQTSLLESEMMHLWRLGWLGLIPLISGIAAFCPVYAVLGKGHQHHHKKDS